MSAACRWSSPVVGTSNTKRTTSKMVADEPRLRGISTRWGPHLVACGSQGDFGQSGPAMDTVPAADPPGAGAISRAKKESGRYTGRLRNQFQRPRVRVPVQPNMEHLPT